MAYDRDPNFEFVAAPTPDTDTARNIEQTIIDGCWGMPGFLNLSKDARYCNRGGPMPEEHKEKLRIASTGKRNSPEALSKQVEVRRNNGQPWHSEETRAKLSEANARRELTPETRDKMLSGARSTMIPVSINGVEYPSGRQAAVALGIPFSTMEPD